MTERSLALTVIAGCMFLLLLLPEDPYPPQASRTLVSVATVNSGGVVSPEPLRLTTPSHLAEKAACKKYGCPSRVRLISVHVSVPSYCHCDI